MRISLQVAHALLQYRCFDPKRFEKCAPQSWISSGVTPREENDATD
jgi:hypothetical protein